MTVSTKPMAIQPSSAMASGAASRSMGRNSRRRSARCADMGHALGCALSYTAIRSVSETCVYFCVVERRACPSSS